MNNGIYEGNKNPTIPEHLYSDEEIMRIVRMAIKKEKETKKAQVVSKSKIIPPEKFLNSRMVRKTYV